MDVYQVAPDLVPEVKPAIEVIHGRWERKVSPKTVHSILQARLSVWLSAWAKGRGYVGTEWRFYMLPREARPCSLVPDLAYVSNERMPPKIDELREKPTIAPDIAIEVLSPRDRRKILEEKIALYFEYGSRVVMIVDPQRERVRVVEPGSERVFGPGEDAICGAYSDVSLTIDALFDGLN